MKQVLAVLIGAGLRGANAYAPYALKYPNELKFVAVAEPRAALRMAFQAAHGLRDDQCFDSWEPLLAKGKIADCALICTQDRQHCQPTVRALEVGYDVLCEKPMSPVAEEIREMTQAAERTGHMLSICHVLRYASFYQEIKRLLNDGVIGRLISIQHMESVGYYHAAHSFVRGNWRNSSETSPMILQKCCHDMDILRWLADSPCAEVNSYGELSWFKPENAPAGAPQYCMDGCPNRDDCPFEATRFYLTHPLRIVDGFAQAVSQDISDAGLLKALRHGPYGRCVYHCDNDVVDHQVVGLRFQNGVTATLQMCDFTAHCERTTTLMGTRGQIDGNMRTSEILVRDFASGKETRICVPIGEGMHGGSDERMMRDFVRHVAEGSATCSTARASAESHLMALAAEEARLHPTVQTVY